MDFALVLFQVRASCRVCPQVEHITFLAFSDFCGDDPQILFFDEPSAGLDPINAEELETLIRGINADLGTTMVIVSHQVDLVLRVAHRIVMLDSGVRGIVAAGSPEELRDTATDPRVRNFLFRGEDAAGKR